MMQLMAPITPGKKESLNIRMAELGILEKELEEKFIVGTGKGGQKQNKTASCVYIKHIPTGIEVKSQKTRSREENRFFARRQLCELVDEEKNGVLSKRSADQEKIRKQKNRRKRRAKEKE